MVFKDKLVFILIAFFITSNLFADVELSRFDKKWKSKTNPKILISNEIAAGDYKKFLSLVHDTYINGDLDHLHIMFDTSGGDVLEAIKIGEIVRKLKLHTSFLLGQCDSACIFIHLAGVKRLGSSGIGIHRPYFDKTYFSGLSYDEAKTKYNSLALASKKYLIEMGAPNELIETMFRIPSNEIYHLSLDETNKWISGSPIIFDEWLISKCGSFSSKEENDHARLYAGPGKIRKDNDFSDGYIDYLLEKVRRVEACRWVETTLERDKIAKELFKNYG